MSEEKIKLEPGVYEDIPFEQYKKISAINHSTLKEFSENSPYHFKYKRDNDVDDDTEALQEGRLLHEAVLEPEIFAEKYEATPSHWKPYADILPDESIEKLEKRHARMFDGRTKEHKIIFNHFKADIAKQNQKLREKHGDEHMEIEVVDYKLYKKVEDMRDAMLENKVVNRLLKDAEKEVTLVWIDEETGLKCKGRLDVNSGMKSYFADIKKTKSANPKWWVRDMQKYHYNSQAAFYMDGAETLGYEKYKTIIWLCIEAHKPYYVQPFFVRANSKWIDYGRQWYHNQMEKLNYCINTGDWHGYYDDENDNFNLYELPEPQW